MDQIIASFGLTVSQMRILFSLECYLTYEDAHQEQLFTEKIKFWRMAYSNKTTLKKVWLNRYIDSLNTFIEQDTKSEIYHIFKTPVEIRELITKENQKAESDMWKYLILLECSVFTPYFPLNEKDEKEKTYKNLAVSKDVRMNCLEHIASWLDIDFVFVINILKQYESTVKKMNGYWTKFFIGVGEGVVVALLAVVSGGTLIAAFFAAEGLSGAAAVSGGLAALGSGAIAAGCF